MGPRAPNFKPAEDAIIVHHLMGELLYSGLNAKGKFRDTIWDEIALKLQHDGYEYKGSSIKGRFDRLRTTIEEVDSLKGKPGFSWDATNHTLVATSKVWDETLQTNEGARRLRNKKFPLYSDIMEIITTTSGAYTGRRSASVSTRFSSVESMQTESTDATAHIQEVRADVNNVNNTYIPTMATYNNFGLSHVVTHSLEEHIFWKMDIKTSPTHAHSILRRARVQNDTGPLWLDAPKTVYPIFAAIADLVQAGDDAWTQLVLDGIVVTLCRRTLDLPPYISSLTYLPSDLQRQAEEIIPSPFYPPLQILCHAAHRLIPGSSLSLTDNLFLNTVKSYWPSILQRVWNEPFQTTNTRDQHIEERLVIARLFYQLEVLDPSFMNYFDCADDVSIPLLARLWKYCTGAADIAAVATAISELLYPRTSTAQALRSAGNMNDKIVSQLLQGLGSDAEQFCKTFIIRLLQLPFEDIPRFAELFAELYHACQNGEDALCLHFNTTMSHYLPFWLNGFALLRQMTSGLAVSGEPHHRIALAVIGHAASCLYDSLDNSYRCEGIITQWMTADVLGTFDVVLPHYLVYEPFAVQAARIFRGLCLSLERYPNLAPAYLATQFPRPRSCRALSDWKTTGASHPELKGVLWDMWTLLEKLSRAGREHGCGRRGCGNTAVTECKRGICGVRYCSNQCRHQDWNEHRWICASLSDSK